MSNLNNNTKSLDAANSNKASDEIVLGDEIVTEDMNQFTIDADEAIETIVAGKIAAEDTSEFTIHTVDFDFVGGAV